MCRQVNNAPETHVKLVPKLEGILIKPKVQDPLSQLRGLARGVWPDELSSVKIIREIRRRTDLETKEQLRGRAACNGLVAQYEQMGRKTITAGSESLSEV